MFDSRRLLDTLVGALAKAGAPVGSGQSGGAMLDQVMDTINRAGGGAVGQVLGQATDGLRDAAQRVGGTTGGLGAQVDQAAAAAGLPPTGDLVQKAKDLAAQNPALAQAALAGVAGLLLTTRRGRGLAGTAAGLGGLALIGGLAYKAYQNHQAGRPLVDVTGAAPAATPGQGPDTGDVSRSLADLSMPETSKFHPVSQTEDDALLYLRAMVAAAAADGQIDAAERARITQGLTQAGIDPEATRWLDREFADPADVEELAAGVNDPEKAARVYTAARIAIDPDTIQEREFLRQLGDSLDVDQDLRAQIDATAAAVRAPG